MKRKTTAGKRPKAKTAPIETRGPSLGDVARIKVLGSAGQDEGDACIGHSFLFPREIIKKSWSEVRRVGRKDEPVYVTITEMPGPYGYGKMGRILLSYDKAAHVCYGGIFFMREGTRTCVQSIYIVPAYRRAGFGAWLAELAKTCKIKCTFAPVSDDGHAWSTRAGFKIVGDK